MPLVGTSPVLSTALRVALLANPQSGALDNAALTALCDAIADAVLTHIVANAVVNTTGTAAAQVGVIL